MTKTDTTNDVLARIDPSMILTTAQITTIETLGMSGDDPSITQEDWDDFRGSTELNNLIYMAYKLKALLKTLEPT